MSATATFTPGSALTRAQVAAFRAAERGQKPVEIKAPPVAPNVSPSVAHAAVVKAMAAHVQNAASGFTQMQGNITLPIATIMQILMEVLAAAPGVESTIEQAVTSFHASGASTPEKIAAITTAASQLGAVASALVPTPTPTATVAGAAGH